MTDTYGSRMQPATDLLLGSHLHNSLPACISLLLTEKWISNHCMRSNTHCSITAAAFTNAAASDTHLKAASTFPYLHVACQLNVLFLQERLRLPTRQWIPARHVH